MSTDEAALLPFLITTISKALWCLPHSFFFFFYDFSLGAQKIWEIESSTSSSLS